VDKHNKKETRVTFAYNLFIVGKDGS
jgi:hypothetical protein